MENKKRLIDVDEVLKKLRKVEPSLKVVSVVGVKAVSIDAVIRYLERQKTVDAVEVVHGRWEEDPYVWKCNQCRTWFEDPQGTADMNYCPNCGAKMDGGQND